MSLPRLTPTDLDALAFKRFRAVFNLNGAWAIKDDPATFAREWLDVLKWTSPAELTRGVNLWIASKDKWPTPGQLYGLIRDSEPKREFVVKDSQDLDDCGCSPGCRFRWYRLEGWTPENRRERRIQDCVARRRHLEAA